MKFLVHCVSIICINTFPPFFPPDIRYKGGLIGAQTSQIIKLTAARPNERKTKILKPLNMISAGLVDDNPWGLELSNKMTEVDGMSSNDALWYP